MVYTLINAKLTLLLRLFNASSSICFYVSIRRRFGIRSNQNALSRPEIQVGDFLCLAFGFEYLVHIRNTYGAALSAFKQI